MLVRTSSAWFCVFFVALICHGADRSQFRGPDGNGVYPQGVPTEWDGSADVSWSVEIPGGGWSSPVAAKGVVFVTTAVADGESRPKGFGEGVQSMGSFFRSRAPDKPYRFEVHCVSLEDGSTKWKKEVVSRKPPYKIHPSNSYATESPVTDGERLYVYYAAVGVVAALDYDGNILWKRELGAFKTGTDFGTGSSLSMHEGMLFVQCDNEEQSFVCGIDCKTGEDVWRKDRNSRTSWSSPIIWSNPLRSELIVCGSGTLTAYEPKTGKELWMMNGLGGSFSASPTFDEERLYFGQSGRSSRGPLLAVVPGLKGEVSIDEVVEQGLGWVQEASGPGMCSPVVVNGKVYVLGRGILSCHDAKTGERLYRERIRNASSVTASLWSVGERIFTLNESGETIVVGSGDEFNELGSNSLEGLFWSTPAATDEVLLIRSADKLHCLR